MLGATFRLYRQHFGLTIREAAADMGVTEKTVRNWEQSESDVPTVGARYMKKQAKDSAYCTKFFRNLGGRGSNFVVVCASLEDIYFFFPQISVHNISYAAYRFGVMAAIVRSAKEVSMVNVLAYKQWLKKTESKDGLESRDLYIAECASVGSGNIKAGTPKGARLVQCSLLERQE